MGGNYIGKSAANLFEILKLYNIPEEEHLLIFKVITSIDNERRVILRAKMKT